MSLKPTDLVEYLEAGELGPAEDAEVWPKYDAAGRPVPRRLASAVR